MLPPATVQLAPPVIVQPAPYEVSFGRVEGRAAPGTRRIRVFVDGRLSAEKTLARRRFALTVLLPRRDVTVRVVAVGSLGRRAATSVGPVFGLPAVAAPYGRAPPALPGFEDPALARSVRSFTRRFRGTCAVFVQDLRTGAGTAWNARARFPAASTLKLAIAVEALRTRSSVPARGTRLDVLLRRMLVVSDSKAANAVLASIGGSVLAGSARVNTMLRALGLNDTDMYGGYIPDTRTPAVLGRRPIPLRLESEPSFVGKRTTAWDLARLARAVHLAAGGSGPLVRRFRGAFTPSDARYLLFVLARVREPGRLSRYLAGGAAVLHKAGWIEKARHDNGLVYWSGGAFVVTVMTWNGAGVGAASDVLAGRVARAAFDSLGLRPG